MSPRRGFYVIVPAKYRAAGAPPVSWFIDDARLDTLFLAMPVSWRGTLVQYAGHLHRQHHAKTEVRILDYLEDDATVIEYDEEVLGSLDNDFP